MKAQDGFTLAELLVVLALIALVGAFTLPLLTRPASEERLEANIIRLMTTARHIASTEGRYVDVIFDPATGRATVDGKTTAFVLDRGMRIEFRSARRPRSDGKPAFRFFTNGASTGGKLIITRAGGQQEVNLNWLTGAASISVPQP